MAARGFATISRAELPTLMACTFDPDRLPAVQAQLTADRIVTWLDLYQGQALLRISLAPYTTGDGLERLLASLDSAGRGGQNRC